MKTPTRILVIEDNPDDEALLRRQLKKAELDPHIKNISDGGKALDYLTNPRSKAENLSAVFLDLCLPTVGGLTVLEKTIRGNKRLQHLPVIVMISSNPPVELEKCRRLGVSTYVAKPLTLSSFAKAFADTFHSGRSEARARPVSAGVSE